MLVYQTGDLMNADEPIIMHGCNAQGVMGSGVAKAIRAAYPMAFDDYRTAYLRDGLTVGDVHWTWLNHMDTPRIIGNAITQQYYGRSGAQYVSYDGITSVFEVARKFLETHSSVFDLAKPQIAIPKIGSSLGGGKWTEISRRITDVMGRYAVTVYSLESDQ